MFLDKILKVALRGGASDVILKVGSLPRFRYQGELIDLHDGALISTEIMDKWVTEVVPSHLTANLSNMQDLDFAFESSQGFRFRVNMFRQRRHLGMVLRVINNHIRTLEELQLPEAVGSFTKKKRGLILVTGATGTGKSTTLAAIIDKINKDSRSHVVTIEDPIEYLFKDNQSTINQREIGTDTPSFPVAMRSALRQSPDVILVGELRDKETTETALMAAETGHLVLSTLHTQDAVESLTRLLSYFPPTQHEMLRLMLSQVLSAVVSQRLISKKDKSGMVAAMEILVMNELTREEIRLGKNYEVIREAIRTGKETYGMQSFDQSLIDLYKKEIVSLEEALNQASNRQDLEMNIQGINS